MILNAEVGQILALVGISPASIPARDPEIAAAHMDVIVRFIGYKAGLEAARRGGEHFDVDADESALLGRFVRTKLLSSGSDSMHGAALHDMRRMLALVEGATGYRMTSEAVAPDGGNRVITDGFPKGWFVEDRTGENTAVLVAPNHSDSGELAGNAICMRPPLVSTEEWLAVAHRIAREMDPKASHRRMTVRRVSKSPVKIRRLSWERREYEGTGYPLFSTGNVQYVARAGDKAFCVSSFDGNLWRYGDRFDYPNPEAAMEDAQRDFEAPIRALLLNEDIVTEEERPLLRSTVASSS